MADNRLILFLPSVIIIIITFILGSALNFYVIIKAIRKPRNFLQHPLELNISLLGVVMCFLVSPILAAEHIKCYIRVVSHSLICKLTYSSVKGIEFILSVNLILLSFRRWKKIRTLDVCRKSQKLDLCLLILTWTVGLSVSLLLIALMYTDNNVKDVMKQTCQTKKLSPDHYINIINYFNSLFYISSIVVIISVNLSILKFLRKPMVFPLTGQQILPPKNNNVDKSHSGPTSSLHPTSCNFQTSTKSENRGSSPFGKSIFKKQEMEIFSISGTTDPESAHSIKYQNMNKILQSELIDKIYPQIYEKMHKQKMFPSKKSNFADELPKHSVIRTSTILFDEKQNEEFRSDAEKIQGDFTNLRNSNHTTTIRSSVTNFETSTSNIFYKNIHPAFANACPKSFHDAQNTCQIQSTNLNMSEIKQTIGLLQPELSPLTIPILVKQVKKTTFHSTELSTIINSESENNGDFESNHNSINKSVQNEHEEVKDYQSSFDDTYKYRRRKAIVSAQHPNFFMPHTLQIQRGSDVSLVSNIHPACQGSRKEQMNMPVAFTRRFRMKKIVFRNLMIELVIFVLLLSPQYIESVLLYSTNNIYTDSIASLTQSVSLLLFAINPWLYVIKNKNIMNDL